MALRFYLDEDVKRAVALGLQGRGVDVLRTQDAKHSGVADSEQLKFAHETSRILLTHDSDYAKLHAHGVAHAGILYCHQGKYSIGQLIHLVCLYNAVFTENELHGVLEYL